MDCNTGEKQHHARVIIHAHCGRSLISWPSKNDQGLFTGETDPTRQVLQVQSSSKLDNRGANTFGPEARITPVSYSQLPI